MTAPHSGNPSAGRPRRSTQSNSQSNSLLSCSLWTAVAMAACFSAVEARDTFTVSAGYQHSCIVTADASVKCFGYNKNGELGLGDNVNRGDDSGGMGDLLGDVDLGTEAAATAVSAGWTHTCALLEGGSVKCWGRNNWGQLGQGDYVDRGDDPLTMGNNLTAIDLGSAPSGNGTAVATAITTGQQFTCVLVEGGGVKCFGRNDEGQCGRGNLDESVGSNDEDMGDNLPYVDLGEGVEAVSISSGTATTCAALLGGGIKCWGGNSYGGLGVGDTYNVGDEPTDMGDNVKEVDLGTGEVGHAVVLGLRHACAILVGGSVKCWGDNRSGQLGLGHVATMGDDADELGDNLPFVDLGGETATSMSLGESHSCAVLGDGTVRCWGKSFRGQLGRGEYYARGKYPGEMGTGLEAVDLGANVTATSLAAGNDHTCAALDDGSLKCWGMNVLGALGLEDTLDRGDGPDEMGDALPAVSLGTGVTVAPDEGAAVATVAPTAAPTPAATPQPTPQATPQPSAAQADVDAPSPQPSPVPTPEPTAEATEEATEEATPAPTAASRDAEPLESAGTGDDGVFSSDNITVAAYVAAPLLAFSLLACFCARRRRREPDSASAAAVNPWAKGGTSAGVEGSGGYAPRGRSAAVAGGSGGLALDNSSAGSRKILPSSSSFSPVPERNNSRVMEKAPDLEEMNLAGHLVVGGGASAAGGAGAGSSRENGKSGKHRAKKFAQCGSDTAFAMTSSEDVVDDATTAAGVRAGAAGGGAAYGARGGGESDSSGGAGTGRSSSPAGYDEYTAHERSIEDDAAASTFDARSMGRRVEEDELSENGWGPSGSRDNSHARSGGPPSYEETQHREQREREREAELYGGDVVMRSYSNRERNSERTLARAAATARSGRRGGSRRADGSRSS
eukprot:g8429.t1